MKYLCMYLCITCRLMAKIIDGKRISIEIQSDLKVEIEKWRKQTNVEPSLATILVGSDPASAVYIAKKVEAAEAVGKYLTLLFYNFY